MAARLWGSHFSAREIEEARSSGRLLSLELELSHVCNLACTYCYSAAGRKLPDELTFTEIEDVLDQAAALGARRVIVLGGGEPLCYPRIGDVFTAIHARGMAIDLFSNASLITPEIARELARVRAWPVVKKNSLDPAVQDALAGRAGAQAEMERGFQNLIAAGYPLDDAPLGIQTVICRQNLAELPDLWIWARERGYVPYFEMMTLQGRAREHPELDVSVTEVRALFEALSRLDRERYGVRWEPQPPIAGLRCARHEYSMTVKATGEVLPCPGVEVPAGNVREKSLAELLRTQVFDDMRNVRTRIKGVCRECDSNPVCYGCRGMAYQATGDYLAPDPLCWKHTCEAAHG